MDEVSGADIGAILRETRLRIGLTQQQLAERSGLSVGAVRDLEQGRSSRPRSGSLGALAEILGVELRGFLPPPAPAPAPPTGPLRISVLGPLAMSRGGRPVALGSGRHRAVLARLAISPGQAVSPDELIGILWGESAPATAANVLQTHVSRLRRTLPPSVLVLAPGGYRLDVDDDGIDLLEYRARLAQWRKAVAGDPQRAFDVLGDGLDLWQGVSPVEDVSELQNDPLVTALSDELVDATVRLAHLGEALRRLPEVLPRLRRLAPRHPWHESLHARLVVALAATGQQAAALETYDRIRTRLGGELGIDPGPELAEARQGVLERRWGGRPPAASGPRGGAVRLPGAPRDFTGRSGELRQLVRQLRRPAPRCVIAGMPGVGKTSLALRAAQEVRDHFPDGQLYIDLRGADRDPLSDAAALTRLLTALGVEGRDIPADPAAAASRYREALAGRRVLLVLDNARGAAQVLPLLPDGNASAVLITSRNQCADLDPAYRLDLDVLSAADALELLDRCLGGDLVADHPDTALALVEACGRLPVTLRVVAGRLAGRPDWTMADLLDRLRAGTARADAASAGFDLSYRHLDREAARAFRTAALIPGDTFPAAAVAAMLPSVEGVDRDLDGLVEESLLQAAGPGRYRFHDLLRVYAAARLDAEERPEAMSRLIRWYLGRTAAAMRLVYPGLVRLPTDVDDAPVRFRDVDAATAWLDEEAGTLAALVPAAAAGGFPERSWQLADQLRGYFFLRRDSAAWLATGRAGLAAARRAGDATGEAAMHQTLGQAQWSIGRHKDALIAYGEGVICARRGGWSVGEAYLTHNLGLVHAQLGRVAEAQDLYERALRIGDGEDFAHIRAATLNDLGSLCVEQGSLEQAVRHFGSALDLNRGAGRRPSAMGNHSNLGMALRQLERFDEAREHLTVALAHYRETGAVNNQMAVLDELSQLYAQQAEWHAAVDSATEALRIAGTLDDPRSTAGVLNSLGAAMLGSRAVDEAHARFAASRELCQTNGYPYMEAQAALGIAAAALASGDMASSVVAAGEALALATRKGYQALAGDAHLFLARVVTPEKIAFHANAALLAYGGGGAPAKLREAKALLARKAGGVGAM